MTIMFPLFLILGGCAAMLVYLGIRRPSATVSIDERLAQFAERPMSLEELELTQPFKDRVLSPSVLKLARSFARFTPRSNIEKLRQNLIEAGSPEGFSEPVQTLCVRQQHAV